MSQFRGVCCTCQSSVDLFQSSVGRQELRELGWDDESIDKEFGANLECSPVNYLCCSHEFCGDLCEGSNMVPQTVIGDGS